MTEREEGTVAESTSTQEAEEGVQLEEDAEANVSEYTTESAPEGGRRAPARPVVTGKAMGTGRRKEAIARVRIAPGTGQWLVNDRPLEKFFPNKVHQQLIREPFVTTEKVDQYDVIATLVGGGVTGQAGALRLGIARALINIEAEDRPALKKAGFLTRDPRVKERKKYGLKKARKAPQYSKR